MPFQAGDVLGYYQPEISRSGLIIHLEEEGLGQRQLGYYYPRDSAASQLNVTGPGDGRFQIFINVVTGESVSNPIDQMLLNNGLMSCRPSRLHLQFYECREDEASGRTGQCWQYWFYRETAANHTRYQVHM